MINDRHSSYEEYIKFQAQKTTDPTKRQKWLTEEWSTKIEGFKAEFSKISGNLNKDSRILCLGARTGQEVQAFIDLGFENVKGIDIVPCEPLVIVGDIHDIPFPDESFDAVYTNIVDHSIDPKKMMEETERVLKVGGIAFLQMQVGIPQDEYTEFEIKNPVHDVIPLFERSFCVHAGFHNQQGQPNFAGMNFDCLFQKDETLDKLYQKYGKYESLNIPEDYERLWKEINLDVQTSKLNENGITDADRRQSILNSLPKRAFYLTRIAEAFDKNRIAEVGTAEGWQFYNFCQYATESEGIVFSCDPRDVRNPKYREFFEVEKEVGHFTQGTSRDMSEVVQNVGIFYIDGLHDKGTVFADVQNLAQAQDPESIPVWIFDDFDIRFGCFQDILSLCLASHRFKVVKIGETASGQPSHQAIVYARFNFNGN